VPRAKEYAFLLYTMVVAAAYGVAHDHVTATISPEYFLYGKRLSEASQPFSLYWPCAQACPPDCSAEPCFLSRTDRTATEGRDR
jgi:hypothetical protein